MQSCSATANTYFFCIFNVICAAFKAHLFSTSAWGFILFLWVFYGRDLGWGGGGRRMSAGGACEDDELVRDPFCCFPWYSQLLIPSAKAVLNADAPLAS